MDSDFEKKLYAYGLNTATVDYLKGEGIDRFVFFEIEPLHLQRTPIRLRDQLLICRMIRLAKEKSLDITATVYKNPSLPDCATPTDVFDSPSVDFYDDDGVLWCENIG
ncbi:hypothetical protein DMENIID0001_018430 [Sergentomyia squamirostris]